MFGLRVLSFTSLLCYLQAVIGTIKDPRQPRNGTKYTVKDAILRAFSAFFMQCESFLYDLRIDRKHQICVMKKSRCRRGLIALLIGVNLT